MIDCNQQHGLSITVVPLPVRGPPACCSPRWLRTMGRSNNHGEQAGRPEFFISHFRMCLFAMIIFRRHSRWCFPACLLAAALLHAFLPAVVAQNSGVRFFEQKIRPLFAEHCFKCHSEEAGEQQGGLLLDRRIGWIKGGDTQEAVLPGEPDESLLISAVRYMDESLQMPPDHRLSEQQVQLLEQWIRIGAPGPENDPGETEFSRLGDQDFLFGQAESHWAFQPIQVPELPAVEDLDWNGHPIDRLVLDKLSRHGMSPAPQAEPRTLLRRLNYALTGLPPTMAATTEFAALIRTDRAAAINDVVGGLIASPAFGQHLARLWLDVARYADTDSAYRPDTKTPHYFPFAFTYRDYVVEAFNDDKPINQFIREQLAADLMGFDAGDPQIAALGFLAVGPHANRNASETIDDWIDVTTRGLMGITAACARCHDHKYEPVPTADYYSLHGVFSSTKRVHPLDEERLPLVASYVASDEQRLAYEKARSTIDSKINKSSGQKTKNNNRSLVEKIRETELAELLLFHRGAPARAMVVHDARKPVDPVVLIRGQAGARGPAVPRRFLQILDPDQTPFPSDSSGRLQLAEKITSDDNPLTARVFVNRVWGYLVGTHLVDTPSDFGLQGAEPSHQELLDWLAHDFVSSGWSLKHLVRTIVQSKTFQQASRYRGDMSKLDPENRMHWRGHRRHLTIEELRDSVLAVCGSLDDASGGRPEQLWGQDYSRRRAIYGYINRFNLDPTLRAFDFPTPMQSQASRGESIVPTQALFILNSPFVIDQTVVLTSTSQFTALESDKDRIERLFAFILQRSPAAPERNRVLRFIDLQNRFQDKMSQAQKWPLVAQAIMMSNEFQYVD